MTVRTTRGEDIDAACGQLVGQVLTGRVEASDTSLYASCRASRVRRKLLRTDPEGMLMILRAALLLY